jgi:hypothetical protein
MGGNMKIIRVLNPRGVDVMEGKILQNPDYTEGQLTGVLKWAMENQSQNLFLVQAWEGDQLAAFMYAWVVEGQKHVFLEQAWADAKLVGKDVLSSMLTMICIWANSMGKMEIRTEVIQHSDALLRRWNFKPHSEILSFDISDFFAQASAVLSQQKPDDNLDTKVSTEITPDEKLKLQSEDSQLPECESTKGRSEPSNNDQ